MTSLPVEFYIVFLFAKYSDGYWKGGYGHGQNGFHSGYGHQGHGYGSGICANARQRQGSGGGGFPQQNYQSSYPYQGEFGGYNNGYYPNVIPIQSQPVQPYQIDFRINTPSTARTTTVAPVLYCSYPSTRDTTFDQKCLFPYENERKECSSRGSSLPAGTTAITSCKAPEYRSDNGDMILEVCKDGKWLNDGKTLTCKSQLNQPTFQSTPELPARDPIVQYVQNPYISKDPVISNAIPPLNSFEESMSDPNSTYWNQRIVTPHPYYFVHHTTTEPPTTTTTTTTLATTTHKPYYFPENLDWRNYDKNQNNRNYETKSGNCPALINKPGVILECISKTFKSGSSSYLMSVSDCSEQQLQGSEATYKCQMYYEPLTGVTTQYRKCKENGMWSGSDDGFGCKLECGKSNPTGRLPLITFGEMTILGQWPWHAALFIRDRGEMGNSCGGTLITQKAVLTAAHCVNLHLSSLLRDLNDIRVDLGRYNKEKDDPYVQKFQVEKIISHPAYNPLMFESDIAIVILKDAARIGYHVRPICFPKTQNTAFDEMQLADGSYATVVGWGIDETGESPDELRAAKLKVIGYRECIESFEEADTGALLAKSTTFCAGNKNGTNVCRGDSGSGAFFPVKMSTGSTRWYLQGLVSLGINMSGKDKRCDPEKVSIFTRVSPYSDWIVKVLSENDAF